jgi:hypothetical protein
LQRAYAPIKQIIVSSRVRWVVWRLSTASAFTFGPQTTVYSPQSAVCGRPVASLSRAFFGPLTLTK